MAQFPAITFWTDAYLGDTTHLTTIEHGAYMLLLWAMWRTGEARLPADDVLLARYAKLGPRQWQRMKPIIMEFFDLDGAYISQARLVDEWSRCRTVSEKASASANAKWLKHKKGRHAVALRTQCVGNAPTTTTTTTKESNILLIEGDERDGNSTGKTQPLGKRTPAIKRTAEKDFLEFYALYPRKVGKKAAEKAYRKAAKDTSAGTILDGLRRWIPAWHDPQYVPYPATWLNRGGWDDQVGLSNGQAPHDEAELARVRAMTPEQRMAHAREVVENLRQQTEAKHERTQA
jgi:uncharacterized protein YdaU (DUF1376 family)